MTKRFRKNLLFLLFLTLPALLISWLVCFPISLALCTVWSLIILRLLFKIWRWYKRSKVGVKDFALGSLIFVDYLGEDGLVKCHEIDSLKDREWVGPARLIHSDNFSLNFSLREGFSVYIARRTSGEASLFVPYVEYWNR